MRKKVIRVACNQGVENSHANPNRLNQWYQTTLVRLPFKASLPAFGIGEPRGQDPQEPFCRFLTSLRTPSFTIRPSRSFVFLAGGLITHIIGFQNDRAIYLLRVNYSDQRNNKPRIFNSGGTRCDRYCPYHGTLCLCAKHGFGDRQRGAISNGVN